MTRSPGYLLAVLLVAAALLSSAARRTAAQATDQSPAGTQPPTAGPFVDPSSTRRDTAGASRWRFNARGRTEAAIEHQSEGELAAAGEAFGTALDLAPADPLLQFNAGTAGLIGAGGPATPDAAAQSVALLQSAADSAPAELKPLAFYNLGNAHYAGQRYDQAIEAYKESLRLDPGHLDAKHNLELAQRQLQEQQKQQESSDQQDENQEQEQQQEEQQQEQQNQQDQQNPEEPQQEGGEQEQQRKESPLPDFEDQPDMTAEQAAAILEAVENLEREQRRKQAMEQLKRAKGDRDW